MNEYRGKHAPSTPWPVASSASVPVRAARHLRKNKHRRIKWILLLIFLLLLAVWPFLEARILTTDQVILKSEALPADANHLRVVFLSDIHWGFWYTDGDLGRLVATVNSLRPDLVIFGGDYATDHDSALRFFKTLQSLPKIHARYGIFGVPGESDCGEDAQDRTLLKEAMSNAGITPLFNSSERILIGSGKICIAGIDDVIGGKPDLKAVVASVSDADYVIFVAHNPSIIPEIQLTRDASGSLNWLHLGLFGHTHGGQMKLFSSLLGIAEDVPERYLSGWFTENRVDLLVSRGIGTSVFPGRFLCPPQIHLFEIVAY